ncbi:MAG: amidohydrolase family protein [Propylenella sp.]
MPTFPIVDAHVHLVEPGRLSYGWTRDAPSLNRRLLPAHFLRAAAPVEIEKFVFVEVDVDAPLHLAEAEWIAEVAGPEPQLAGMVASLPIERGSAIERELDKLREHALLRGIRRLIQSQPDPEFCVRPDFIAGLKLLAKHDLSFDICIYHHQFPAAIRMARQCPEVRFVLDHIGKPAIRDGLLDPWRQHISELAALPNVWCKISGVATEANHKNWTREELRPYIDHAIECFGFDRVMFGGDWHVCDLAIAYPDWVALVDWAVAGASESEKRKLFRDNAMSFYRLGG